MSTMNYSDKIPNNVNLSEDRTLQRALSNGNLITSIGGMIWVLIIHTILMFIYVLL